MTLGQEENMSQEAQVQPKVDKVKTSDLRPAIPESGGTVIVLQRNAKDKDNRKLPIDSPDFGALDVGEDQATVTQAKEFFDQVFKGLDPEERRKVDILVVGADTTLIMPDGKTSPHKRGMETAEYVLSGIRSSMAEFSLPETQLLNKPEGQEANRILKVAEDQAKVGPIKPVELTSGRLRDLKMMEDSPEFVRFMVDKYGAGQPFWVAYEDDREKETRVRMGAEGPLEIADRVGDYMAVLDNAMKSYHHLHPDRRVVVWAVSQYDSISPFLKRHVTGTPLADYLPVDYRGGVVFNIGRDGQVKTEIQGQQYNVRLAA